MTFLVNERWAAGVSPNVVWDVATLSWVRMTQPLIEAGSVNLGSAVNASIVTGSTTATVEERKQTPTGNALNVQIGPGDVISNIPIVVDYAHHQVHEGETHQAVHAPAALAQNASLNFRLVVGNLAATTRTPHLVVEIDSTGESWCYLYEGPTTTGDGTPMTSRNRNRNSGTSASMTVYSAPTITADGTLLTGWIVGSGEKAGGSGRDAVEWDLAANTVYLVRITAKNANNVAVRFQWYEDLGV